MTEFSVYLAAAATALIETLFFRLCGYRGRRELTLVALANLLTNLTLNLALRLIAAAGEAPKPLSAAVLIGEALVVAAEYLLLASDLKRGRKLLLTVTAANCLSFGLGLILARLL